MKFTDGLLYLGHAYENSPLHIAAIKGHVAMVQDIVSKMIVDGKDINVINQAGDTPLHCAARAGHLSIVRYLVEQGADVSLKNKAGHTAVQCAQQEGHKEVAFFLASCHTNVGV